MKKRWLLALGLIYGIIFPISTFAYENGIYETNDNGTILKTVIYGDTELTMKMTDQSGSKYYNWGFNYNKENSVWSGTEFSFGTGTYIDENDGKMHGNTNGVNNAWGGINDNKIKKDLADYAKS